MGTPAAGVEWHYRRPPSLDGLIFIFRVSGVDISRSTRPSRGPTIDCVGCGLMEQCGETCALGDQVKSVFCIHQLRGYGGPPRSKTFARFFSRRRMRVGGRGWYVGPLRRCTHLPVLRARPAVSFAASERYRPATNAELYAALATEAHAHKRIA